MTTKVFLFILFLFLLYFTSCEGIISTDSNEQETSENTDHDKDPDSSESDLLPELTDLEAVDDICKNISVPLKWDTNVPSYFL